MPTQLQSIRGMHDILPSHADQWQFLETAIGEWLATYGYREIRCPIVEKTELFKRTIGEVTDIVEKEMYTFEDRNSDSLSLRPEGTAGVVRAGIQHGLLYNQVQRFWYMGPMFRHERPQKGRYRQFNQLGVEAFGMSGPDIDAEQVFMTARLWRILGLQGLTLQVNSLATSETRGHYRTRLLSYLEERRELLDEDSLRRLTTNPLRILDSKNPAMTEVINGAPILMDYLDDESAKHFSQFCSLLENAGMSYEINPRLVRGLDYYGKTVFEWVTTRLGAQGTICAGGRYDSLVEQLGGSATPAVGFAMGLERILVMLDDDNRLPPDWTPQCYLVMVGEKAQQHGMLLAERLRDAIKGLTLLTNCSGGSFKSQLKKADKSGAAIALIVGENEVENGQVTVKYLREDRPQEIQGEETLMEILKQR